jgi:hypothetical protein
MNSIIGVVNRPSAINIQPAVIGGREGNVVLDRNGQPIRNVAGGNLEVMPPPVQAGRNVTTPLQNPDRLGRDSISFNRSSFS